MDIAKPAPVAEPERPLVHRQSIWTRATHWVWALCLFFLLLSGLQIFNAHPALYIGDQSGFQFDNSVLRIGARREDGGLVGVTTVFGKNFETTGVLGASGPEGRLQNRAFPAWATIPSYQDLATGRVVHFFFAWILAGTLLVWLVASLINGHLRRDIVPGSADLKGLPRDVSEHVRLKFRHRRSYNPLQKLSYAVVLLVFLPLMIATGLAMSPGVNAVVPWLPELFGGRQSARTLHFVIMVLLVLFFIVHIIMVVAAGPINELRSMITGWGRVDADERDKR
ncbi:cytochrome b/b6 domain-containing protein [Aliihoeflea sp. PC F10.4]